MPMSTNTNSPDLQEMGSKVNEPEENLAVTAYDPCFSALEFDRDHGTEVEAARRELAAQWEGLHSAA